MNIIGIESYLIIGLVLFLIGLFTAISRKNIIGIFMGIELILNSSALNFAAFSRFSARSLEGQLFSIFIIVIAAAEAAIALALLLSIYRRFGDIDADKLDSMKG
ncbi:MAG: NADH-quinone oxidoreductase subunit NuoK [Nitrospira bacterium HGW-Nitrospira-1]|nr:MAG: NADH-quinone oxidoreductase subunit NuoK [Nitrospira bacterium HGW-Nitrospira-1]